jgi:Predicted phosphohydrolases
MRKLITATLGLAALGAGAYAYARYEARQYKKQVIAVENASLRLGATNGDGMWDASHNVRTLKVLHISDLHLTNNESRAKLEFLEEITDDEYDFIFLTGDIFQDDQAVRHAKSILSRLPRIGAYAVLGNHDYYRYSMFNKTIGRLLPKHRHPSKKPRNVEPLVDALTSVGYQVLRSEARYLKDEKICIVGVDYPTIERERMKKLVARAPEDWLVLALFHIPLQLDAYEAAGVDFAFGGHTHGGQIRVPGFGAIITDSELGRREASGVTLRGRTVFHVSRGLGADPRTNFRIFCPPEANVLELTYAHSRRALLPSISLIAERN